MLRAWWGKAGWTPTAHPAPWTPARAVPRSAKSALPSHGSGPVAAPVTWFQENSLGSPVPRTAALRGNARLDPAPSPYSHSESRSSGP